MWKLYLDYLTEINSIETLNVYSRFCRLFIDNSNIRNDFRNEIERMQSLGHRVAKWWADTIQFECDFDSAKEARQVLKRAMEAQVIEPELMEFAKAFEQQWENLSEVKRNEAGLYLQPLNAETATPGEHMDFKTERFFNGFSDLYTFEEPLGQHYSIPNTAIFHILNNADAALLRKLFGLCKAIFAKFKIVLCHDLHINFKFRGSSPCGSTLLLDNIYNLYVTNSLYVASGPRNYMEWLSQELYRCDVKNMDLFSQDIPIEILNFFIRSNKVNSISFTDCTVLHSNGKLFTVEEVVALFPNASKIK